MNGKRFYMRDCPHDMQVAQWLDAQTGFHALGRALRPRRRLPPLFEIAGLDLNIPALTQAVREVFAAHGWHGWQHSQGRSPAYGGFSLVYNPDRAEARNLHTDVLGGEAYELTKMFESALPGARGSYADAYSFRLRTPGSRRGHLGRMIDGFRRSLIRSSVRELHARYFYKELAEIGPDHPEASRAGWHCDEAVFEVLRVNIPVTSDPIFTLELADPGAEFAGTAGPLGTPRPQIVFSDQLKPGRAYVWDTYWPHRPMAAEKKDVSRISIVLGLAPWFDYLPEEDAWQANEFLGKVHPFDMLAEGLIHPDIRIAEVSASSAVRDEPVLPPAAPRRAATVDAGSA